MKSVSSIHPYRYSLILHSPFESSKDVSPRHRRMALELSAHIRHQALKLLEDTRRADIDEGEVKHAQKVLLSNLVLLRSANRTVWQESKAAKVRTAEAKIGIDRINLGLQGLYYEQRHLKNEIKSCQDTPTVYDQIELIDEEDFLKLKPECRDLDAPQLMQARLDHEKEERLRLDSVRKDLLSRKSALIQENKKRKNDLEALEKQLTRFVSSAGDISSMFEQY